MNGQVFDSRTRNCPLILFGVCESRAITAAVDGAAASFASVSAGGAVVDPWYLYGAGSMLRHLNTERRGGATLENIWNGRLYSTINRRSSRDSTGLRLTVLEDIQGQSVQRRTTD